MRIFYSGAEQSGWRKKLSELGAEDVSLSWYGLRRRGKKQLAMPLSEMFPGDERVYVDAGTFSLNKSDETAYEEAEELAGEYYDYVRRNIDRVEIASEFDAMVLGKSQIRLLRENANLPVDKIMPVWHSEYGTADLRAMATLYPRLGILQDDADDSDLTQLLRNVAKDTKLHGVGMTRMEAMKNVPWDSVGSTSWLSPTQYGDTFVWTGRELKRYPKKMRDQARKRHRSWLTDQGFNVEKIESGDNDELLRLSVWSWQNFAASLQQGRAVTINPLMPFGENEETGDDEVATPGTRERNGELAPRDGKKLLPVLGFTYEEATDADGSKHDVPVMETPSSGLLQCDFCFLRDKCPAMTPGSDCLYEIPVKIRTASQMAALQDSMIEMQTQRVLFMRMIEQTEGGYVDANLSQEMDRLNKLIKGKIDASKEGFSIKIEASQSSASSGMISRIFGSSTADRMSALPQGEVASQDILEAHVVEDQ